MGLGGNAGMEREPSHLARIDEPIVWPAVRQGLQREHFTPLLWSYRNAVRNGPLLCIPAPAALVSPFTSTSQQLIDRRIRVGIRAVVSEIAVFGIAH